MYSGSIKEIKFFTVDIQAIKEDSGAFDCPNCGKRIDPHDETDDNYIVLEPQVLDNTLIRLPLKCIGCHAIITLENFSVADKNSGEIKT